MISGKQEGILSECIIAWRCIALSGRAGAKLEDKWISARSRASAQSRMAAERVGTQLDVILLLQCIAGWRLGACMEAMESSDSRRFRRCSSLGRICLIRLRGRLQQQAAWLRWSLYCRMKPRAPLISLQGTQAKGVQVAPDFCAEPPKFFVRPVSVGNWPIAHISSVHEASTEVSSGRQHAWEVPPQRSLQLQVTNSTSGPPASERQEDEAVTAARAAMAAAATTTTATTCSPALANSASARALLAPAERYKLANNATVSDGDYRKLLEHNRREIRENRTGDEPSRKSLVGWGVWTT